MNWRSILLGKNPMKLRVGAFGLILALFIIYSLVRPNNKAIDFEAVNWHVMGKEAHMSFRVMPNSNQQTFRLDVWLPTGMGEPKQVAVWLNHSREPESRIEIPMAFLSGGADPYGFEGFDKYTYRAKDNLITEYGDWNLSITITDPSGQVHPYDKTFSINEL